MALSFLTKVADKSKLFFAQQIEVQAQAEVEGMTRRAARAFVAEARIYPPENEGNRPPHPYWQRGVGLTHAGGHVHPSSQNLGPSWTVSGFKTPFGGEATATNTVTYLPWVHDEQRQAGFHRRRGWRTITEIADAVGLKVQKGAEGYTVVQAETYIQQSAGKIRAFMQAFFSR